jgi:hypothetical protein
MLALLYSSRRLDENGQKGIVDMKNSGNAKHSMGIVWSTKEEFKGLNQWMMTKHQNYKVPGKSSQDKIIKLVSDNYDGALLYLLQSK